MRCPVGSLSAVLFLVATKRLYKRLCPSVGPSVRPSVRPSVGPSVRRSDRPSVPPSVRWSVANAFIKTSEIRVTAPAQQPRLMPGRVSGLV